MMFEISFKSPIIELFCSFLERKKCFRHANRWKRVSFPFSLFLSCDNHFPYTCIEFNYKNISGKKGAESKLYSKLKLH